MTVALLQACASSARLPGNVMHPICGEPMVGRQIERLRRAKGISRLVVATSVSREDDDLSAYVRRLGVDVFRGSPRDVLSRMLLAAHCYGAADQVLRLTADRPLADPDLVDLCLARHAEAGADLTYSQDGWTRPEGPEVEVVRLGALRTAGREAHDSYDREHVTTYIHARPDRFRLRPLDGGAAAQGLA